MDANPLTQSAAVSLTAPERSEGFFRNLVEHLPAAAYTCDADGLITYVNRRAAAVWGREPCLNDPADRFSGAAKLFSANGTPLERSECWMALALREGRSFSGEEVVVERPDGSRLTLLAQVDPLLDDKGKLLGAINVLIDISQRKSAEEAPARLAAIVQSSDDAIVSKDLNGVVQSWNVGAERLFGFSAEEVIGQPITIIIPNDRLEEEDEILARLRRGERVEHYETVRLRKDGSSRDVALTISPIIDSAGRIVGASKIARDITETKRAQEALEEQARTLATINRVAATVSAELDLDRLAQIVTDAGTELSHAQFGAFFYNDREHEVESFTLYAVSGVPREEFNDLPMPRNTEIFGPTLRGESVIRSEDITSDARYGRNPPHNGLPVGHPAVRSYLAVPVKSRTGEVLGGLFFGHAEPGVFTHQAEVVITALASHAATAIDNAHLYEEARRINETLEEKVEQRTADLVTLNEELETFNYSVAHDLRGSLRGIDGFSQLVLEENLDRLSESSKEYLSRVQRATRHMGAVIDDLLELSKLIRVPLVRVDVDLTELAHESVNHLRECNSQRVVQIEIEEGMRARGDAGLLRVVLDNLLSNSWKFTRDADPARIEVGSTTEDGSVVYFVSDNGAGFDTAYANKLYLPFQRLHPPGAYEGTGIGLATVQRIIRKHGGRIWADGEPGKGAIFWFTLEDR